MKLLWVTLIVVLGLVVLFGYVFPLLDPFLPFSASGSLSS
jgi:hypothetical protein